jgi:hypothetical protein
MATELEDLISRLPGEKSRQLAANASHKQAKGFRELVAKAKES